MRSDNCLAMELDDQPYIAHLEFQSTQDPEMPERLLEYALRIIRNDPQHRLVYSCVIYVRPVGEVQQPPLVWEHWGLPTEGTESRNRKVGRKSPLEA